MRYFLRLAYNGTAYHGWQVQPDMTTVQGVIQKSMSLLLRKEIEIVGAGRTDTGVHATEYFAHFDCEDLPVEDFIFRLNSLLPNDIAINNLYPMTEKAHARFDALLRSYTYTITTRKDPFLTGTAYYTWTKLDLNRMNKAAAILQTYHDFESFSKSNTDVNNYLCQIEEANWVQENHLLIFKITANRFLRNMVRAIVGTLINVGLGKQPPEQLHEIIASKNRSMAGVSVPAHGLSLTKITYPETIFRDKKL